MAYIAIFIATIFDIPTLVTLVCSASTKSLWKAILIALVAAFLGEVINLIFRPTYSFMSFYIYRAVGQLMVAILVFKVSTIFRGDNRKAKIKLVLGLVLGLMSIVIIAIVYMEIQQSRNSSLQQAKNSSQSPLKKDYLKLMPDPIQTSSQSSSVQPMDKQTAQAMVEAHKKVTGSYLPAAETVMPEAEKGMSEAQNIIAMHYKHGTGGLPQNYALAYMWLNLASMQGNQTAIDARTNLIPLMTPQQIEQGQVYTKEWLEGHNQN